MAGMLRGRHLSRAIADQGWGELAHMAGYKAGWYGCRLIVADRWYASPKTCSRCGALKAELGLDTRTYHCEHCGLVIDRDLGAALALAAYGRAVLGEEARAQTFQHVAASAAETLNARGGASSGLVATPGGTGPGEAGTGLLLTQVA